MKYLLPLLLLFILSCKKDKNEDPAPVNEKAKYLSYIGKELLPAKFESFRQKCQQLEDDCKAFVSTSNANELNMARKSWKDMALAFQEIEPFSYGKVKDEYLYFHISNWPVQVNKIRDLLQGTEAINSNVLDKKGGSVKGIWAIEYLLFEEKASVDSVIAHFKNSTRRKDLLQASSTHLRSKATKIQSAWSDSENDFVANEGNTVKDPFPQHINSIVHLVESVLFREIGKPFGKTGNNLDPFMIKGYRSACGKDLQKASLNIVRQCIQEDGKGLYLYLNQLNAKHDGELLSSQLLTQESLCQSKLDKLSAPLHNLAKSSSSEIDATYDAIKTFLSLMKADLTNSLSVTLTVSDNDGD